MTAFQTSVAWTHRSKCYKNFPVRIGYYTGKRVVHISLKSHHDNEIEDGDSNSEESVFEEQLEDLADYRRRLEALLDAQHVAGGVSERNQPLLDSKKKGVIEQWLDDKLCPGGVCIEHVEQCEIPEEYKNSEQSPKVDVMSFLGIKRAEPIGLLIRDWD